MFIMGVSRWGVPIISSYFLRNAVETMRRRRLVKILGDDRPDYIALDIRGNSTSCEDTPLISEELFLKCAEYENVVLRFRERYAFDTSGAATLISFMKQYPSDIWICGNVKPVRDVFEVSKLEDIERLHLCDFEDWKDIRNSLLDNLGDD